MVVCPAYNEEESVGAVVAELLAALPGVEVVVVDDGSTDRTADRAAAAGARVLRLPFNMGPGAAVRTGLVLGVRQGVDAVVQCDADGQHPAAAVPDLVARLSEADLVIGARWAGEGTYQARGPRRWAMWVLAAVMSSLHSTRLTDVTSGFRAFGPRAQAVLAREMPPEYLGDTLDALVIARSSRLRVVQVPVAMRARSTGVASHRPLRSALFLARSCLLLLLSLSRLLRPRGTAA